MTSCLSEDRKCPNAQTFRKFNEKSRPNASDGDPMPPAQ